MRQLLWALPLGLLQGCAGPQTSPREWLVGDWLEMSAETKHPLQCASDVGITYKTDGSYSLLEEIGTWRLEGNVLTETATEAADAGDPAEVEAGRPYVSTIRKLSKDRFEKRLADGQILDYRRCPDRE